MKTLDNDSVKMDVIRLRHSGVSYRDIEQKTGIPRSTINRFMTKQTYKDWWKEHSKPIALGTKHDHHNEVKKATGNRFILTSAQNNTYVHEKFLASLETMADHIGAQIIVGTFSYNTNGFQSLEKGDGEWFDPKIAQYIVDEPLQIASDLIWCGELNILPTAVNPLSGMLSYTKKASGIIPHAKVQLESVPTHKSDPVRMMYTTGAVTLRNYIQKKAGQKAAFHHVFGALLVEVDNDGDWFVRQLIAESESGEFYDLTNKYTPTLVETDVPVEAINWGDIHIEQVDEEATKACFFSDGSMLNELQPKYQFFHDILDFKSRNHHNIKDPYFRFKTFVNGQDSVYDNVKAVSDFLFNVLQENSFSYPIVVESNHDLALKRWLKEADYKTDPANAIFFLSCQLEMYKSIERGDYHFNILEYAVKEIEPDLHCVSFLGTDESFKICDEHGDGIECGAHGHTGNNGGRGSINAFQIRGSRYNVGHSHTAAIRDGVYYAGTMSKLDMGYNQGGSSWSHSEIVTYDNGKRTIVTIKNGKWRAQ